MKKLTYLLIVGVFLLNPSTMFAWKPSDAEAVRFGWVYTSDGECVPVEGGGTPSNLPGSVPTKLREVFTQAADRYNVDVALIAAVYWQEQGGTWREPPPPYGNGGAYASSPVGASGPFQFMPPTWGAYGVDADGDGNKNIQDLKDAAYASANYLKALGATADVPYGSTDDFKRPGTAVYLMSAYNWGPGSVAGASSFAAFPAETRNYIERGGRTFQALKSGDTGEVVVPEAEDASCESGDSADSSGSGGSVVEIAQAELAKNVAENPPGSNSGGRIDVYTDNTPEYWCADFVSWVYKAAGKPFTGGLSGGWRIPSVNTLDDWLKNKGTRVANESGAPAPKPGDVVIFDHSGDQVGNDTHTGIVEKIVGGKMITIEGNTSDKVARRTYDNYRSNNTIRSWGRP